MADTQDAAETPYWLTEDFCRQHGLKGASLLFREFGGVKRTTWMDRRVSMHEAFPALVPKLDRLGRPVGSLKGGDEYALNELGEYGDPVQKLVGCHEKYGVSWRLPLNVNEFDDTPSRYEDAIPGGAK